MHAEGNSFTALTRKHFSYLETAYGFTLVECTANELDGGRLVYHNEDTGVRVRFYDGVMDLSVEVGRLVDGELPDMPRLCTTNKTVNVLRIRQIVRNRAPEDVVDVGLWRATMLESGEENLDALLAYHARVLRQHAGDMLEGDFSVLAEVGDNICGKYAFGRQIRHYFGFLFDAFGYEVTEQEYVPRFSGCASVTLESPEFVVTFSLDGRGVEVRVGIQHQDGPPIDLADIFSFLTHEVNVSDSRLYYFPSYSTGMSYDENSDWQVRRLAALLRPMWQHIQETARPLSATHTAFQTAEAERAKSYKDAAVRVLDGYRYPPEKSADRSAMSFEPLVSGIFGFLEDQHGYECVHSDPIFVRYETSAEPCIFINVYHTLNRYRVGIHTGLVQTGRWSERSYSIEEFAALQGARLEKWPLVAETTAALHEELEALARQFRRYCAPLLAHDAVIFDHLYRRRIRRALRTIEAWIEEDENARMT